MRSDQTGQSRKTESCHQPNRVQAAKCHPVLFFIHAPVGDVPEKMVKTASHENGYRN